MSLFKSTPTSKKISDLGQILSSSVAPGLLKGEWDLSQPHILVWISHEKGYDISVRRTFPFG